MYHNLKDILETMSWNYCTSYYRRVHFKSLSVSQMYFIHSFAGTYRFRRKMQEKVLSIMLAQFNRDQLVVQEHECRNCENQFESNRLTIT